VVGAKLCPSRNWVWDHCFKGSIDVIISWSLGTVLCTMYSEVEPHKHTYWEAQSVWTSGLSENNATAGRPSLPSQNNDNIYSETWKTMTTFTLKHGNIQHSTWEQIKCTYELKLHLTSQSTFIILEKDFREFQTQKRTEQSLVWSDWRGFTFQSRNLMLNGSERHDWMVNFSVCPRAPAARWQSWLSLWVFFFSLLAWGHAVGLWSYSSSSSHSYGLTPTLSLSLPALESVRVPPIPSTKLIPELRASCLSQSQRSYSWRPGQSLHCCTHILGIKAMRNKLQRQKWILIIITQLKGSIL